MSVNKLVIIGVITTVQAIAQMIFALIMIAEYICFINLLRDYPTLIFIKAIYFQRIGTCGNVINVGYAMDEMYKDAYIRLTSETDTSIRTFQINIISFLLAIFWIASSALMISGGKNHSKSINVRWPWLLVTLLTTLLDQFACYSITNDSYSSETLNDVLLLIKGVSSGFQGNNLDTTWVAWLMVLVYSKFIIIHVMNYGLMTIIFLDYSSEWNQSNEITTNGRNDLDEEGSSISSREAHLNNEDKVVEFLLKNLNTIMVEPVRPPKLTRRNSRRIPEIRNFNDAASRKTLRCRQQMDDVWVPMRSHLEKSFVDASGRRSIKVRGITGKYNKSLTEQSRGDERLLRVKRRHSRRVPRWSIENTTFRRANIEQEPKTRFAPISEENLPTASNHEQSVCVCEVCEGIGCNEPTKPDSMDLNTNSSWYTTAAPSVTPDYNAIEPYKKASKKIRK